jgi:hypothetical protein
MTFFFVYAVSFNDPDPTICDPPPSSTEPVVYEHLDMTVCPPLLSSTLAVTEPDVLIMTLRNREVRTRPSSTLAATEPVVRVKTVRNRIVCPPPPFRPSSSLVAMEPEVRVNDLDNRTVCPPHPSSSLAATST